MIDGPLSDNSAGDGPAGDGLRRDDPQPLYRQIKQRLRGQIERGELGTDAKLASERALEKQYGVSRITVRQAVRELVQEGWLHSHPGRGFFVARREETYELHLLRSFTAIAEAHGRTPTSRLIEGYVCRAPAEVARPLFLPPGADVVMLKRLRCLDRQPVVLTQDWFAARLVPGILDLDWSTGNRSLYAEVRDRYRLRPDRGRTTMSARLANAEEAELLELTPPAAVLTIEQIAYDPQGRPVNMTFSTHHPLRYPLSLDQRG
ncbi:GntR family transcriptional regulator [Inquilinus sp. CA228]|uniref:GntR family transcriptional regulator n=1 Tax=Inquilinus sp. CA228 TaxID=3455609 RepID=UPI003F8D2A18